MNTITNHPYYCSESNYYSNDANIEFETVSEFLDTYEKLDIDLNLCFRFDIYEHDEKDNGLYAQFFFMQQRKGKFSPVYCNKYNPEIEFERLEKFLKRHYDKLQQIWTEFSGVSVKD